MHHGRKEVVWIGFAKNDNGTAGVKLSLYHHWYMCINKSVFMLKCVKVQVKRAGSVCMRLWS